MGALQSSVRVGGKGTVRRKKKIVHKASSTDDKKLQSQLKKLSINPIPGIEEVNMFKDDGSVLHFQNPKVQASPNARWRCRAPKLKPPRKTTSPNSKATLRKKAKRKKKLRKLNKRLTVELNS